MPEIGIESLDLAKAVAYLGSDDDEDSWTQFDDYHRAALRRLEASGAEVALVASNTPHHRFVRGIQIPVISILEEAAKESARVGARLVLLLGTALTMRSHRFREVRENLTQSSLGCRSRQDCHPDRGSIPNACPMAGWSAS
jgi:aspartate racemase